VKFAVQLINGSKPLMKNVVDCFQGDFARIREVGEDWFLESSAFDGCTAPGQVFPIADEILLVMQRITAVHGRLFQFCEIGYVEAFSDAGVPVTRGLRATQRVQVYSLEGLQELQKSQGEQSWGSTLVAAAMAEEKLREALALIGDGYELQWPHLYNILEFLGGENAIVKRKWATRGQVRRCRQTANHYRHLGSPKRYPLPANPTSRGEAAALVLDLLKKWISDEFFRVTRNS
jgi:hypothetical protein